MDKFQISHEAYHELRMVSKNQLPPVRKIATEKKLMSEEIPYMKHPTVNALNLLLPCTCILLNILLIKNIILYILHCLTG